MKKQTIIILSIVIFLIIVSISTFLIISSINKSEDNTATNECKKECFFVKGTWYFKSFDYKTGFETQDQCLDYCKINN